MKHASIVLAGVAVLLLSQVPAAAQSHDNRFEIGGHFTNVTSTEFDHQDPGFGGWFTWHAAPYLGVEAETTFYPRELRNNDGLAISSRRYEALFGVTAGPVFGPVRPYVRLRPGFVKFDPSPAPVACLTIYPPLLSCVLLPGKTMFATDFGGGVEFAAGGHGVLRVDAGDRMLKYPGPAIDSNGALQESEFFGHDFFFSVGAGVRF